MKTHRQVFWMALAILASFVLVGCAPGNERFAAESPAGFFWGLWHGAISMITLVVGIFSDSVSVYEAQNTGGWYDFGFLLGVAAAWGGGGRGGEHTWKKRGNRTREEAQRNQEEWEEVGRKVEAKIKRKLRDWAEAEPEEDWSEVERKIEVKVREVVKDWAEKES
jgi:hypothetical protein